MFDRVKELAKQRDITIKELSEKLGFSENYFYSLKSGSKISSDKLQAVATFFNVSTDYLLGRTDVPQWATQEDVIAIDEALKRNVSMSYGGQVMSDDDKERVNAILRIVLWDRQKKKKDRS